jgi:hypothetical protein
MTPKKAGGTLTATMNTDTTTVRVELAPQSYLDKIGLTLKEDDQVTLTGLQSVNKKNQTLTVSVQALKLGDKTFQLRDEKNKAMWLPSWKTKKMTGVVKEIKMPAAAATGDARLVSITLDSPKNPTITVLLAPTDYLTKIGLVMMENDTATISGAIDMHNDQSPMLAAQVKWHGVTFILRDNKRHALWEATPPPTTIAPTPTTPVGAATK